MSEIRKVQMTGNGSLTVVIPSTYCKDFIIQDGTEVEWTREMDKLILVVVQDGQG